MEFRAGDDGHAPEAWASLDATHPSPLPAVHEPLGYPGIPGPRTAVLQSTEMVPEDVSLEPAPLACGRGESREPETVSADLTAPVVGRDPAAFPSLRALIATREGPGLLGDPIEPLAEGILEALGEDLSREGLRRTPRRMAKALRELTSGYAAPVAEIVNGALFDAEGFREVITVRDVEFYSLCEHHLLPFFGRVSVAYIPGAKIIGLSKIPRLIDLYARRLQVQERLTVQIAQALQDVLDPEGIAVCATGFHLCMAMRGVAKQGSVTTTTAFLGSFGRDARRREEFLRLVEPSGEPPWTGRRLS